MGLGIKMTSGLLQSSRLQESLRVDAELRLSNSSVPPCFFHNRLVLVPGGCMVCLAYSSCRVCNQDAAVSLVRTMVTQMRVGLDRGTDSGTIRDQYCDHICLSVLP